MNVSPEHHATHSSTAPGKTGMPDADVTRAHGLSSETAPGLAMASSLSSRSMAQRIGAAIVVIGMLAVLVDGAVTCFNATP